MTTTPLLQIESIAKQFEGRSLFKKIDLKIHPGEKISITGRSGSGKTTLLNILGLLETADAGQLLYKETPITDAAQIRNEKIGFVFQFHYLNPELTVFENLELPRLIQRKALSQEEAKNLLNPFSLSDRLHSKAKYLSGGEKQRVAFARALVNHPEIILADEPTGQLDQEQAYILMEALLKLPQAVVIVTHDLTFAARCERRFVLEQETLMPC